MQYYSPFIGQSFHGPYFGADGRKICTWRFKWEDDTCISLPCNLSYMIHPKFVSLSPPVALSHSLSLSRCPSPTSCSPLPYSHIVPLLTSHGKMVHCINTMKIFSPFFSHCGTTFKLVESYDLLHFEVRGMGNQRWETEKGENFEEWNWWGCDMDGDSNSGVCRLELTRSKWGHLSLTASETL